MIIGLSICKYLWDSVWNLHKPVCETCISVWNLHALKRKPSWEEHTRLIPSVFSMLSIYGFLKRVKTVWRILLQTDKFFLSSDKKSASPTRTQINVSGIHEKQNFFDFILQVSRIAIILSRFLYLLFRVALWNQPTVALRHWKWYQTGTFKPYFTPLWAIAFSKVTFLNFGEVSKTCRRMHSKFRGHFPLKTYLHQIIIFLSKFPCFNWRPK